MTCANTSYSIPGDCPLLSSPSRFIEMALIKRTWYITNHAMTEEKCKLYRSHTVHFFQITRQNCCDTRQWAVGGGVMKWNSRWPPLLEPLPLFLRSPGSASVGPWASACTFVPQHCRLCDIEIVYSFVYSVSYLEFFFCARLLNAFPEWFQPSGISFVSLF
jgi:hypothetical protein